MNFNKYLPKQRIVNNKIGGIREITARLSFYIGILNLILTGTMNYYLVAKNVFPINFAIFVMAISMFLLVATIVDYFWIYPSHIAFTTKQLYIHNNPMVEDIKQIKKKLGIDDNNHEKK